VYPTAKVDYRRPTLRPFRIWAHDVDGRRWARSLPRLACCRQRAFRQRVRMARSVAFCRFVEVVGPGGGVGNVVSFTHPYTACSAVFHHDGVRAALHHSPPPRCLTDGLVGKHRVALTDGALDEDFSGNRLKMRVQHSDTEPLPRIGGDEILVQLLEAEGRGRHRAALRRRWHPRRATPRNSRTWFSRALA
jgi:hypothetical protein